jgi:hypothetical protein
MCCIILAVPSAQLSSINDAMCQHETIDCLIPFQLIYRYRNYKSGSSDHEDGFYKIQTMVYNTQAYWVCGLRPSSSTLKNQRT